MASPPPALALADRSRLHVVRPLSPDRYEFRFTGRAATREKLRRAQDLLSHAIPSGDIGEVFDRTLTLLVEDLTRKKYAAVTRPRAARRNARSSGGIIPAAVRRAVFERDAGRCAFVSTSGRQCGDRRFLELHHVIPRAAGGEATVDNIQLRCRAHNGHEVDLFFGPGKRYRKDVTVGPAAPPFPFRNGTPGTLPARTDTPAGAGTGG